MEKEDLKQNYANMLIYEVAKIKEVGLTDKVLVSYITTSTIPWVSENYKDIDSFLPLHPLAADIIRDAHQNGEQVYILKDWNKNSNEVLFTSVERNPITNLENYKLRAIGFIKSYINPIMANVHASIIYGFTTLNNKFIEKGYVFSEENKTLKYIEIIEKSEEILENENIDPQIAQNLSDELTNDLEKYIEYREILDRSNFAWVESEKYVAKIKEQEQKEDIDIIVNEFQIKINALNNLV